MKKIIENNRSSDQFTVVLEDINSKFSLVLEQFSGLNNKIDNNHQEFLEFKDEMIDFRSEMIAFKGEMTDFKGEMTDFRKQTNENFSVVMEYLSRIDEEIQDMKVESRNLRETLKKKADLDKLEGFERRLLAVEKILRAKMAQ
jgi:predicted  nucleic acid-binding Zn-ribbon protein